MMDLKVQTIQSQFFESKPDTIYGGGRKLYWNSLLGDDLLVVWRDHFIKEYKCKKP